MFHYLANIYGWSWETFWYKTPIAVLKVLPKYLNKLWSRGWLGHNEVMYVKAISRTKGYKGFEDYGTGKILKEAGDVEDPDSDLDIDEDEEEYVPPKDWGESTGKAVGDYQISD